MTIFLAINYSKQTPSINGNTETMKASLFIIHMTKCEPFMKGDRKK